MAHRTVQLIVGQILTDEEFRSDFLGQPIETLTSLRERGFELTNVEVDALARTDCRFWTVAPEWIDGRLHRCRPPWRRTEVTEVRRSTGIAKAISVWKWLCEESRL
jgi:hypothetical protein